MDRRTFIGAVAGGLAAAPLVARTQTPGTGRHLGDPGRPRKTAKGALHAAAPDGPLVFTEGVPSRIDVSALIPQGADRYTGGYYSEQPGTYSYNDRIPGITFDAATKTFVYDGSPLSAAPFHRNPNPSFFVGAESAPYNAHWQYPPRTLDIPQAIGGVQRAITGACKHTRPRYCPRDRLIHIFGGDYSSAGLINDGRQDGRMMMWNFDPVNNGWGRDYPVFGRIGEDMPLSPDIMGFSWDPTREIWWITYGDCRPGVGSDAHWKSLGGLATAWPSTYTDSINVPLFVFDPKLAQPKYIKLGNLPWDIDRLKMRESAYDDTSKRLYKMGPYGSLSFRVYWLDTTLYETDPLNMPWTYQDMDLRAGAAGNLTGSGDYRYITGLQESPMHVDDVTRRLFFIDSRNRAILALTLPGHPLGEHKVQLVASLPTMADFSMAPLGLQGCSEMPFMWVPEHRSLVLLAEPQWQQIGPLQASFTINVDTGVVTEGPRWPSRASPSGKPWFPNAGVWYPPTQEIVVYACYADDSLSDVAVAPQTMHCYAWVP